MTGASVADRLAGQHVLLTGVTGFVGEALLHLLLSEVPGVRVTVLVRPKGSTTAEARIATLLEKPIFAGLEDAGGPGRGALRRPDRRARRCRPTSTRSCTAPATCRSTRRSTRASPPTWSAPATCWPGSGRPAATRTTCTSRRRTSPAGAAAHIPEAPVDHDVDLEAELRAGACRSGARSSTSAASASCWSASAARPRRRTAAPGCSPPRPPPRRRRKEWVKDELVRVGTERARSLGWTDCYTFTKALGERVVEAYAAERPRRCRSSARASSSPPSSSPHPGWIEGFKMAEPLILAYGRGELPEFPAAADTIVDIVPVDHVVAAIVAVLAHPPEPGEPAYFHVSSGDRNPLTFGTLYDIVREYFDHHPFTAGDRGAARLPEWRFPGAQPVERLLSHQRAGLQGRRLRARPRAAQRPRPRPGPQARPAGPPAGVPAPLPRPLQGVRQGRAALLRRPHAGALPTRCRRRTGEPFAFDTAVIDWPHYLHRRALPGGHRADPPPRRAPAPRASGRRARRADAASAGEHRASPRSSTWTARCCRPT